MSRHYRSTQQKNQKKKKKQKQKQCPAKAIRDLQQQ
jgi:hypothetical protein